MSLISDIVTFFVAAVTAAVASPLAPMERRIEQTFQVAPGSNVDVDLSGGRILVTTTPGRTVHVTLIQRVDASSERAAEAALADYTVLVTQDGPQVRVVARRQRGIGWRSWRDGRVRIDAEIAVPADVKVDLDTSGGGIEVKGLRTAALLADTSGGGIRVDGGSGEMRLNTSGGAIRVGQAHGLLHADTSGGGIDVDRVGASARDIALDTSGGGIRVGIEPGARLHIDAATSGGSVTVEGLPIVTSSTSRTHVVGTINGGGGRLRAATSGGGVRISAN